jgi:hypothetical protein
MDQATSRPLPPNKFAWDPETTPKVTLAGIEFPVPRIVWAELKFVVPALMSLTSTLDRMRASGGNLVAATMSEEEMETLGKVVYYGIKRGTPTLSRGEFETMPMSFDELVSAVFVVASQCGMMVKAEDGASGPLAAAPQDQQSPPTSI